MKYTVKSATPTGKVDPTYGSEFIVFFNEDQREVKMSRQKPIEVGQEENGTIVDGKYGAYFKKDATWNQNTTQTQDSHPAATPNAPSAKSWAPRKDNSDGMRQGMCINNAAAYVNSLGAKLSADEWASSVHKYANALYNAGDLQTVESTPDGLPIVEVSEAPVNVQDVLGL